ncbi:MAG: HAD hydrolase family protein [Planctomycetota bacterium]|nr:HAD hydrolase family protein [Planctomycetota bacterium]
MTARAASIRLLCLDVDGVLTDGTVQLDDLGHETKRFNVRDGLGISAVRHRLEELGVRHLYSGSKNKFDDIRDAANACGVPLSAVAFVGDDLPDLPAMRACGYPVAVHDAAAEVRAVAAFVTTAAGGHGAVREVVEHLLRSQNRWNEALSMFDSPSAPDIRAGSGGVQHEQHEQPQST